ncbi:MAG TPA: hypothetical protein VL171_16400 [Verrucomicrobiae bacterium]|nr:hypothetical protein [Verrucomicrobiae bacterium]
MRAFYVFAMAAAALLFATGCNEVEERMAWSPDGTRAYFRSGNVLRLVDTDGHLSAPVASNVEAAVWLPDSQGLVLLRRLTVTNWNEAAQLIPPAEMATVTSLAKGFPGLIRAALTASDEDPEAIEKKFLNPLKIQFSEFISSTILYLHDTQPMALRQAVEGCKNADMFEKDLSNLSTTQVAEVSLLLLSSNQPSGSLRAIERTLGDLEQPRPSSSAPLVSFVRDGALMVAPLDGDTNRVLVAESVQGVYGWTGDGKSLVYAVRLAGKGESDSVQLARIERRTVVDAAGALIENKSQALALSFSGFDPRVESLPDGRVLFASLAQQFPASAQTTQAAHLYWIDPKLGTNAVPVMIASPPGALPQDLSSFVPSPDGRQIAVVENGSDVVAVLNVATGVLEVVSPNHGAKSRTLPAWRGNDELYLAALPQPGARRPEILRWHRGSPLQVFSGSWPDEVVTGLVQKSQ